jgi:streptogramin lyase
MLDNPHDVFVDSSGNLYIADFNNYRIRKVNTSGIISTVAGNGTPGYGGEGGPATSAQLNYIQSVAVDSSGNIYIVNQGNNRVLKVDTSGTISRFAGTGAGGYSGDGGLASSAQLNGPWGVAVDSSGNVYIAEQGNHIIRKVNTSGIISTVVGTGTAGYSGDNGPATSAMLDNPHDVFVDSSGNLYIADFNNYRIRKVSAP